jgi:deazaflavin-dependent oxidoreductase (nitroreductase family)
MTQADDVQARNARVIAEFRANRGHVGGDFAGAPLLLHTVGARTGEPRVNPAMYLPDDGRYLIFATNGGAGDHPAWYRNLMAHPGAQIEVGDHVIAVHATELHGRERDDKYAEQARRYPGFAAYQQNTARTIPVIALTPTSGHDATGSAQEATTVSTSAPTPQPEPLPPDDLRRQLTVARADDPDLLHLSVVGDTYTILLSGDDTGGRFTLIDMYVPPGGGPPPHRHDYEETFVILDGHLDLTFRGTTQAASAGTTINVPANAPHQFHNSSDTPARLLCISAPPGQDEFFTAIGDRVPGCTSPPPDSTRRLRPPASRKP